MIILLFLYFIYFIPILVASVVFDEQSTVLWIIASLHKMLFFFYFSLAFRNVIVMCLGMDFLEFILLAFDEHFQSVYSCHQIWKILCHYVFKCVLFFIHFSHFFWDFSVLSIRSFGIALQVTKALCNFFNCFFLFFAWFFFFLMMYLVS